LGYVDVPPDGDRKDVLTGTYEVEVACERVPAEVSLDPMYDPKNARIRS
jgi:4-methylaminobutanoate oxidase (formaldehyde-forming)